MTSDIYNISDDWDYEAIFERKWKAWILHSIQCFINTIKSDSEALKRKYKENWWVYHLERKNFSYNAIAEYENIKNYSKRVKKLRECLKYNNI